MMLEASGLLEDSAAVGSGGGGGGATIAAAANLKNLEGGDDVRAPAVPDGFEEEERVRGEEGDRNFNGNRWPRDETLALLKIRSEMDVAFRDSTLKAPLWDEVSRKLAELGYHRSAKKCKEKFENIYKYHKRTKESRSRRQNGKNYRFFEQLEHLDNQPSSLPSPSQNKIQSSTTETSIEMGLEPRGMMTMADIVIKPSSVAEDAAIDPRSIPNSSAELFVMSTSTSATSSSGKESQGISGRKKRKLADCFRSLMNEVLEKQENLQNKFIEALDKCERDRIAREEAWKTQELVRIKREQELLAQERDIAAAKDAAVIAFLQKISEQGSPVQFPENPSPTPNRIPISTSTSTPIPIPIPIPYEKTNKKQENGIADKNSSQQVSSSRWPKAEVEALIRLRTNLDMQYQDNGAKGPLWVEISSSMKKLGYNRNAKRCKEKWENINKYYKRVKDSNKRRPEDSKTCPYFHTLESLYEKKSKKVEFLDSSGSNLKPEQILMQMMGHQQQQQEEEQRPESVTEEDGESENVDQNQEDDDEEDDDNGDDYQIVVNNNPASVTNM